MRKSWLICSLLLVVVFQATAQFVNQGTFYIGANTPVSTVQSFTNTGMLINNGRMVFQANLTNTNTFSSTQGAIYLGGTTSQTITSPMAITVSSLTISNTASGTAVYLQTPLWVTQSASFSAGIVQTDATNLLVFADNAQSNGVSNTAHVTGPVRKTGDDSFTFPLGNGTASRPVQLTVLGSPADVYTARYMQGTPPDNSSLLCLSAISGQEYWQIDHTTGSGSAVVGLPNQNVATSNLSLNSPTLRVAGYNGSQWTALSLAQNGGISSGFVISDGATNLSGMFTLANAFDVPGITVQPPSGTLVCTGTNLTVPVTVTGTNGSTTYQWYKDGVSLSTQTSATLTLTSLSATSGSSYSLVITSGCSSVTSTAFSLTVSEAVAILQQPAAGTALCTGQSLSLPVSVSGAGAGYLWYRNGNPLNTQSGATLTLNPLVLNDDGLYLLVITGGCNSVTTNAFSLSVNQTPTVTVSPASTTISGGQSVTLSAQGAAGFLWSTNAATSSIAVSPTQPTTYTVTGTSNGCSASATATVTVDCIQITAQVISTTVLSTLGPGNCAVQLSGRGTGTSFVTQGPGGYIFSTVYRQPGTYSLAAANITKPGMYSFTASFRNACGYESTDSRTFIVGGTACQ
nr:immunoglobulin domain-containing protein [uncultured Arsenicibacter sp.]